jgi:predicted glycosyl hydrolase (DUF1957 family)
MKDVLMPLIDAEWRTILDANAATPYAQEEYERHTRIVKGLLIAFTEGDQSYANALMTAWHDSNEDMRWFTQTWTRDALVDHFNC